MKKIGVLYVGVILLFFLGVYLYIPVSSKIDVSETYRESIEADEYPVAGFRIHNIGKKDQVYTYAILFDDEKFGENTFFLGFNSTFGYSIYPLVFQRKSNATVLIYRGVNDKKKLIYNKTYYLEGLGSKKHLPRDLENVNCYSIPLNVSPYSYRDVDVYSLGAPSFHHYALPIFKENVKQTVSYIRFDHHGDDETFESEPQYRVKLQAIRSNPSKSFYNIITVDEIFGLYNESYLNCGSYMLQIHTDDNVKNVFWVLSRYHPDGADYIVVKSAWAQRENQIYSTYYEVYIFSTFEDASAYILQSSERNIVIDIDADVTKGYFTAYGTGEMEPKQLMKFVDMAFKSHNIEYIVVAGDTMFKEKILK